MFPWRNVLLNGDFRFQLPKVSRKPKISMKSPVNINVPTRELYAVEAKGSFAIVRWLPNVNINRNLKTTKKKEKKTSFAMRKIKAGIHRFENNLFFSILIKRNCLWVQLN